MNLLESCLAKKKTILHQARFTWTFVLLYYYTLYFPSQAKSPYKGSLVKNMMIEINFTQRQNSAIRTYIYLPNNPHRSYQHLVFKIKYKLILRIKYKCDIFDLIMMQRYEKFVYNLCAKSISINIVVFDQKSKNSFLDYYHWFQVVHSEIYGAMTSSK